MDTALRPEPPTLSIESLIDSYAEKLLNRAYYLLSNKEDAEDVVQEVFLAAYDKRGELDQVGSIGGWLFGVLAKKVADLYRERYRKPTERISFEHDFDEHGEWRREDVSRDWLQGEGESLDRLLDDRDFRASFYDCIDRLPRRWGFVVRLCYLEGRAGEQICRELGISATNYWKLLQRSRLQLRECIDLNWFNK